MTCDMNSKMPKDSSIIGIMNSARDTIVLIHGYGFDRRIWFPVEIAFDGFEIIDLSLPGFGDDGLPGAYTISDLATYYWEKLSRSSSSRFHLVGHSMGGYVCLEMAAQHPEKTNSLTLVHSHVFEDSDERKKIRSAVLEEIKNKGKDAFAEKMISSLTGSLQKGNTALTSLLVARGKEYSDDAWYNGTLAIRDRKDHQETLRNIKFPVLMLMGQEDAAVPVELAYKQAALVERCELVVLEGVGHLSMYENTAGVIAALFHFFDRYRS
jgi:pimeloyl-ACP methyl ester carboxylesterase